jgi:hypothetical protein
MLNFVLPSRRFGPNLVSTDGDLWHHQRKIMQPSFTESHNSDVWSETIFQTHCMLQSWAEEIETLPKNRSVNFHDDLRTLTFNIISRGVFGVKLFFPGFESKNIEYGDETKSAKQGNDINDTDLDGDHKLRFRDATLIVVDHLPWLFVMPKLFMSRLTTIAVIEDELP